MTLISRLSCLCPLLLAACACLCGQAQSVGSWKLIQPFSDVDQMAETDQRVYFTSAGGLFFFDKETEEAGGLNRLNRLNGTGITGLYPNFEKNYVMVAYQDGNLDKLYDDGRVVNVPDFRDAIITDTHAVYDVAFAPDADRFYLCTRIGLISFSDSKNEVRSTLYTPRPVWSAARMGDRLVILLEAADVSYHRTALWTDLSGGAEPQKLQQFSTFKKADGSEFFPDGWDFYRLFPTGDSFCCVFNNTSINYLCYFRINWETGVLTYGNINDPVTNKLAEHCHDPYRDCEGRYVFVSPNAAITLEADGTQSSLLLPASLSGKEITMREGPQSLWAGDAEGLAQYALSSQNSQADPTQTRAPWRPSSLSVRDCRMITPTASGNFLVYNGWNDNDYLTMDLMTPTAEGVEFESVIPTEGVEAYYRHNITNSRKDDPKRVAAVYCAVEDPTKPGQYFAGDWYEGVYGFADGKQTHLYNKDNAPIGEIKANYASPVVQMVISPEGTLWEFQETLDGAPQLAAITAANRANPNPTPALWYQPNIKNFTGNRYGAAAMNPEGTMWAHYGLSGLMICQTQRTAATNDDNYVMAPRFIDQDSKYFDQGNPTCMAWDKSGRLWLGSDKGVVEVTPNATNITSEVAKINHLKVPRNDGTNLADYLLDNQSVLSIAVDPSNRKWLTTNESGVYLVAENGNEILEHFTKDNSPLPTNQVYSAACHPANNIVYFGTPDGLLEYRSSSAPGAESYSDVYAYPNPVRPDYSGLITVTGLMDNSLVKIADSAGNVFFQGRSEGGMITWDGCNAAGERVRSGVYFVYASQNQGGSSSGTVAKIMIIR